ncbi:MSC2 [Candida theae]|uniref:Zinc transporter n=1 Tax=Candida theae TaxID=1198502 RepID=A0AAD5BFF1_9ASCO|nr:MSC2 [Candida theae]KAI5958649.1 MSC2 [Candida theae]
MNPSPNPQLGSEWPKTMIGLGYASIVLAFALLRGDVDHVSKLRLDKTVVSVALVMGGFIWLGLSRLSAGISFSMIAVNLITFTIGLVTFQEFSQLKNNGNARGSGGGAAAAAGAAAGGDTIQVLVLFFVGLSLVSSVLKYLVFQQFSFWSCIGDSVLALLIIPGLKSSQRFKSYVNGNINNIDGATTASGTTNSNTTGSVSSSSILSQVVKHQDTRAIFNFLLLNASFMIIQFLYSFRSKSLGLLSDSLHMLLDCLSLALGLVAGVLSKREIDNDSNFPLGWFHLENLAGFTNATLLIGISGSIMFEAVGRLINPVRLQRTNELIVVSVLGLLVNLVGVFAFNHGHSHGHSHSHASPQHDSSHSHSHTHSTASSSHTSNGDDSANDNMRGIFLHILADALGSVGVVISTILTNLFHWQGFDPIASFIIATLILASAIPLIKSTASSLLLKIPASQESVIRNTLHEISHVKGVKSFTTPRFWPSGGGAADTGGGGAAKINGYLHVQIYRGENSWYIKKQIERLFGENGGTFSNDVMVQVENDYDDLMGPAGAGKSTFCNSIIAHMQSIGRRAHIVNLDPAAEPTEFEFTIDIRDLISLQDVMEELDLGPNGGLIYCFEYLLQNLDWLDEEIGDYNDEYLIFDMPGQIELYTHIPVVPTIVQHLKSSLGFNLCACYLLESPFVIDSSKFFSGALSAMSAMVLLELPHINILSKVDLIKDEVSKRKLKQFLNPDPYLLAKQEDEINPQFTKMTKSIANLIDDFGMVQFLPLDCSKDSKSVENILSYIDDVTQWSEAQEPKEPNDEIEIPDDAF